MPESTHKKNPTLGALRNIHTLPHLSVVRRHLGGGGGHVEVSAARVHRVQVVAVRIVAELMVQESMVLLLKVRVERIELLPGGRLVAGVGVVVVAERIGRTDLLRLAALEECDAHFGALRSVVGSGGKRNVH